MPETLSDYLTAAGDRIAQEGAWTQKELARDASGDAVHPRHPRGVCWCASGAIQAVMPGGPWLNALSLLGQVINNFAIPQWNDAHDRTQADVVAAFREAAQLAREHSL